MKHLEDRNIQAYKIVTKSISYPRAYIPRVIDACRAVAYHNMDIEDESKKLRMDKEPLLYLSVLCDELSSWKRFPASKDPRLGMRRISLWRGQA
jgi:hypothetical protein